MRSGRFLRWVLCVGLAGCDGVGPMADAGPWRDGGAPTCQEGEVGVDVGDRIPAVPVQYCSGEDTNIRAEVCGKSFTLLDVGSAALPSCVEATARYATDPTFDELQADGLHIVQVFTTDTTFQPADGEFCASYGAQYAIDFVFLIDPLFNSDTLGAIHPLAFLLNEDGRIVEKWEGSVPADQAAVIAAYLSP